MDAKDRHSIPRESDAGIGGVSLDAFIRVFFGVATVFTTQFDELFQNFACTDSFLTC